MAGQRRKHTRNIGGGQSVTTVRRPPGGTRVEVGFPPSSTLVQEAPFGDKRYIKQLFRRAITSFADIVDDDIPDTGRVTSTLAYIAPDGTIITAHNGQAQISLFVRDIYSGRMRIVPLLDGYRGDGGLHIGVHDAHDPEFGINRTDEVFLCLETANAHEATELEERAILLGHYMTGPHDTVEHAAEFLTRLAVRGGAAGNISISFTRLAPGRVQPAVIALFEGDSAEGNRLAAGLVPVMAGILKYDIAMRNRISAHRPHLF